MPARLLLSVAAGLALWLAFPTHDLWPLAIVGVAMLALATCGASVGQGLLLGGVAGAAFFVPVLSWSGVFVGAVPWLALAVLQSLYVAGLGGASALLQRHRIPVPRWGRGRARPHAAGPDELPRVRPLVVALLWVLQELARGNTPFGGFPWARLAFSQADSPLGRLAALAGAPAVTFGVALAGGLLAAAALALWRRRDGAVVVAAGAVGGAVACVAAPLLVPLPTEGEAVQVMGIQGNVPEVSLEFNAQRRAVLDNHVRLTHEAARQVRQGSLPEPDLVVWPENASDIDPLRNADAARLINGAVDEIGAPLIVGAVLEQPADHLSNASLLYLPGEGLVDSYVKQHPVPFAEYIPYRSFFRSLSDKVDLVATDFTAGTENGVLPIPGPGADFDVGMAICFEVAYDGIVTEDVAEGAELLVVPTNNATFGFTAESEQQLAISRIRAMEHGRSVVHVSTVGVSALIAPDGTAHDRTSLYTSAILSQELPARTELTLATRLGAWPELTAGLAAAILLLTTAGRALAGRLRTRTGDPRPSERPTTEDRSADHPTSQPADAPSAAMSHRGRT